MRELTLALAILLFNILVIGEAYGEDFKKTGNPLDLSITGEGCFFRLTKGNQNKYLKSVSMHFNGNREVVDRYGYEIGIKPPGQTTHIDISKGGAVLAYLNNDLAQEVRLNSLAIYKILKDEKCQVLQGRLYSKN
jgi:flagellar basal body rod protein FlgG